MTRRFLRQAIDKAYRARSLWASRELKAINAFSLADLPRLEKLFTLAGDVAQRGVPGDFVECGVYNGGTAAAVACALRDTKRGILLYDSFAGMPETGELDGPDAKAFVGQCVGDEAEVHRAMRLARFPTERYVIRKGWFQDTFVAEPLPEAVAMLHIDADWYDSVLLTLETFYDLVPDGGLIVLDDFGHWEGCREAFYDFAAQRKIKPLLERFGETQAYWIKNRQHNRPGSACLMISDPLYRQDEIVRLCTGKSVLHLGFILHDQWRERLAEGSWLHLKLLNAAARVVGIDYLSDEVDAIREATGCECLTGDVMRLDETPLAGTFDVIICGELIEHLENPKALLDGMRRFCHRDTQIIITTPNPWDRKWAANMRSGLLEDAWLNPEHVAWYSMRTLKNLLTRCGYEVVRADHYFEETLDLDKSLTGFARWHWLAKRLARRFVTRPQCQPGLFFVARPDANRPANL